MTLFGFDLPKGNYCYNVQWLFENDNKATQDSMGQPIPHSTDHDNIEKASTQIMSLLPHLKNLVHFSVTRRNA